VVKPVFLPKVPVPKKFPIIKPYETIDGLLVSRLRRLLECPREEILSKVERLLKPLSEDAQRALQPPPATVVPPKDKVGKSQMEVLARPDPKKPWPPLSQVSAYIISCEEVVVNVPSVGNFWRFYDIQRVQCSFLIEHIYGFSLSIAGRMPLPLFTEIWKQADYFCPVLATMISHGDLDVYHADIFCLLFGNLPAYTLSLMHIFLRQLKKEVVGDPKYGPDTPSQPIPVEMPKWKREELWRRNRYSEFLDHSNRVIHDITFKVKNFFHDADKFRKIYSNISLPYLCNHLHFLMVYREAIRVRNTYRSNGVPLIYSVRQVRCLPYGVIAPELKEELQMALKRRTVSNPSAIDEKEEIKRSWDDTED
jgi:hypothetical protein